MNANRDSSARGKPEPEQDFRDQSEKVSVLLRRLARDFSSKRFEPANEKLRLMRSMILLFSPPAPGLALIALASQHVVGMASRLFQEDEGVPERDWDAVSAEVETSLYRIDEYLNKSDWNGVFGGVSSLVFAIESLVERLNGVQIAWETREGSESSQVRERVKLLVERAFESVELEQCLSAKRAGSLFLLGEQLFGAAWLTGSNHLRLVSYLLTDVSGGIGNSLSETDWNDDEWNCYVRRLLGLLPALRSGLASEDSKAVLPALDNLCLIATQIRFRSVHYY